MKSNLFFLITILLSINSYIFGCDGCRSDFCYYAENNESEFICYGEISSIDAYKATLKILHIFRGNEIENEIQIWAHKDSIVGKGTSCQELIPMSNITRLGKLNDRIIIGINTITKVENVWDNKGDYRLPLRVNNTPWLIVENDTVKGLISGGLPCYNKKEILKISYSKFKASWQYGKFECDKLSSNFEDIYSELVKIVDNQVFITSNYDSELKTEIFNSIGKLLYSSETECIIDLDKLEKGLLIIRLYDQNGIVFVRKIINN